MKPGPHELAQQHPQKEGVKMNLVMHQTKPCPHEKGTEPSIRLALTFGTLLSSQRTDTHPPQSPDRLGGNPVNPTRPGSQCQPARPDPLCPPSPAHRRPNPCGCGLRG